MIASFCEEDAVYFAFERYESDLNNDSPNVEIPADIFTPERLSKLVNLDISDFLITITCLLIK